MTMEFCGASIAIKSLIDEGVDTIFGYPGGAVLPFYDELFKQDKIRHILVRHEQAAVHAAEAYARSTGKVGVILVTSGPGATNTITGLTDALLDSIPLVCITGQVPTHLIGSDAFQEADTVGITRSCTKHNYLIKDVCDTEKVIKEAFYIARSGRPGPVVVDLPKDVQMHECAYHGGELKVKRPSYKPAGKGDEEAIKQALELIANAKQPILYTGGGIINAGKKASDKLLEFAELAQIPVTNTMMGLGGFPASNDLYVGMLGMHGTYEANMAMSECDVMICIGARFDDRITGKTDEFSVNSKKIHIDIDASSINKNVKIDIPIIGDAALVLEQMLDIWKRKKLATDEADMAKWMGVINQWREIDCLSYEQKGEASKPQYVLDTLNELMKNHDAYVTTDVGQHQMWAAQYLRFDEPKRFMTSGGLGTMGYGLPAAIGAQIAHPEALVVCISGDASVMMNIQELATISQYKLPIKLVILNNQYMGMVRQWQEMFHGNRYSQSYFESIPDFKALAEAFGIKAIVNDDPTKVESVLQEMLDSDEPVIVNMLTDPTENVFPMIPAGAAHFEMKLHPLHKARLEKNNNKKAG